MGKDLLVTPEEYLKSGIHIGTRFRSKGMKKYIYKQRKDGLKVFSIETIDDKLRLLAKFLANYDIEKVAVVGRRTFAKRAVEKFASIVGARAFVDRFVPGLFTNPRAKGFFEPDLVFVVESNLDRQAVKEANAIHVPVVALSSANNSLKNIDFVVPCNNKGKKSLARIFWLLTREYQYTKKIIKSRDDFVHKVEDFEYSGKYKSVKRVVGRRGRFSRRRRF